MTQKAMGDRLPREMVEVVDDFDAPLCILSLGDCDKQFLNRRSVAVFIFDENGKVMLKKRGSGASLFPNRWDVPLSSHLRAGESRSEAAVRSLRQEMGIRGNRPVLRNSMCASPSNGHKFITIFTVSCSSRIAGVRELLNRQKAMFVDREELASLTEDFRETLTPELVLFFEQDLIFP